MTPLFKKLNLGEYRTILVASAPASFEPELALLDGATIVRDPKKSKAIDFAIAFATTLAELDAIAAWLPRATGDAIVWIAYPKQTSKRFRCEFNRDTGWAAIGAAGFETVRQVSIDEDWSALRFRRVEFVKTMKRNEKLAISPVGKKRVEKVVGPTTHDDYLASVSPDFRTALQKLREQIRRAAPKAEESIGYGICSFKLDGKSLVGYGATAKHCALFLMSGTTVADFADELADYDTSKGTIRFRPESPIPAGLVTKLVKARIRQNAGALE